MTREEPHPIVFKLLLLREPELLLDMLECILARPIRALTILDPAIPREQTDDKQVFFDIRAALHDGTRIDLLLASRIEGEAVGEARGRAEGRAEGEARLLLKQLTLRFGPLPDELRARVHSAGLEQLDVWAERVLTAATLDEVFTP